jgi:hypothetical protein
MNPTAHHQKMLANTTVLVVMLLLMNQPKAQLARKFFHAPSTFNLRRDMHFQDDQ